MDLKPQTYVVKKKGETLSAIAKQFGFADWKVIWNDKLNEGLRRTRKTPESIAIGDKIIIPANPAEVKKNKEDLQKAQDILARLRKLRIESEGCFNKMEKDLESDFKKVVSLGDNLDTAAMIATAFVGVAAEGAKLVKGAQAVEAVTKGAALKAAGGVAILEFVVGIAEPSWWAGKITKMITGQDNETAYQTARDQLIKTKYSTLKNLDLKIHDYEKLAKELGG